MPDRVTARAAVSRGDSLIPSSTETTERPAPRGPWRRSLHLARAAGRGHRWRPADPVVPLDEHEICHGLTTDEIAVFAAAAEPRRFDRGVIIRRGDPPEGFYLLTRGAVSVTMDLPDGRFRRLSTLSAGMTFGELAIVDRAPRSADVRADGAVECLAVSVARFEELGRTHPRIKMTVLANLLRNASRMVNRLNSEVAKLAR